jgi:hypothetical protein
MAKPVQEIQKKSKNKRLARDGVITERVRFDASDSRVFRRLGMDLVEVTPEGSQLSISNQSVSNNWLPPRSVFPR